MRSIFRLAIVGVMMGLGATAQAGLLLVGGSLGFDAARNVGYKNMYTPVKNGLCVNNSGTAVGYGDYYVNGTNFGPRPLRWDIIGTAVELGNYGRYSNNFTSAYVFAINNAGTAIGAIAKYVNNNSLGSRAVRWDASGTTATELGNLGTATNGSTSAQAYAVNDAGTIVGFASKYVNGNNLGFRAVRWDAAGTDAIELGNLGTTRSGSTNAYAYAVNIVGTSVGYANKYVNGVSLGDRAVRWDASGTTATELDNLGTATNGSTSTQAYAVNASGTAVGFADKYVNGNNRGKRPVRWNPAGSVATELEILDTTGVTDSIALAINDTGTAVGNSERHINPLNTMPCAVRWDASGTAATELGNFGIWGSCAYAINNAGTTVGYARRIVGGSESNRAVIWLPNANVIDLNDLGVVPVTGSGLWTLTTAKGLSSDGWAAGEGNFDPDGAGPLGSYVRLWVSQVGLGGTWTTAGDGVWGRGPNWSTGTPAMQVGSATFDLNAAYAVALDRDELTKSITVSAGEVTLNLNGHTLATESGLSIGVGAKLAGAGTIQSDITNAGTLSPGSGVGTMSVVGGLTNSGTLEFEIGGVSSHDEIDVSGNFVSGGKIAVDLLSGYAPQYGDSFKLMNFGRFLDNGYSFDFMQASLPGGLSWDTTTFAATGCISVVPEPGMVTLLIMGIGGGLVYGWRKRS